MKFLPSVIFSSLFLPFSFNLTLHFYNSTVLMQRLSFMAQTESRILVPLGTFAMGINIQWLCSFCMAQINSCLYGCFSSWSRYMVSPTGVHTLQHWPGLLAKGLYAVFYLCCNCL